jgi:hypothetical protein
MFALNFYSPLFIDQLRRGRKTATIRLGDKRAKYVRGQLVWVTVGHRHGPRQRLFTAIIDDVAVKRVGDLTQREIERDNPEFRLVEDTRQFLAHIYSRDIADDDEVTVVHFSEVIEFPPLD